MEKKTSRRKYIIATVAIILLCVIVGLTYRAITWTPVDSESKKAIIRQAAARGLMTNLNSVIDPNALTDEDFAKIIDLIFNKKAGRKGYIYPELTDIKFLEKFTNLQELTLMDIRFPDKEIPIWIKILSKLGIFNINERFALDLSPLKKLSKLQHLSLSESHVYNIEPLKYLENLQSLDLLSTQIFDLEPLKDLINLEQLYVGGTNVSNLEPLKRLTNLQNLKFAGTQVSDIEPLKEFRNLKKLYIGNCPNITDEQVEELQNALPDLKIQR